MSTGLAILMSVSAAAHMFSIVVIFAYRKGQDEEYLKFKLDILAMIRNERHYWNNEELQPTIRGQSGAGDRQLKHPERHLAEGDSSIGTITEVKTDRTGIGGQNT